MPRWSLEQCTIARIQLCLPWAWFQRRTHAGVLYFVKHGTHVVGVLRGVEEMWKIPLLEIVGIQAKCFGKRSKSHGKGRHGVDEANVPTPVGELQQFSTRTRGLKFLFALNQTFHDKVRVAALEIVGKSCDVACVLLREFLQTLQKLFNAILATKYLKGGILCRHTHHQIRHMHFRILHGLRIPKDQ